MSDFISKELYQTKEGLKEKLSDPAKEMENYEKIGKNYEKSIEKETEEGKKNPEKISFSPVITENIKNEIYNYINKNGKDEFFNNFINRMAAESVLGRNSLAADIARREIKKFIESDEYLKSKE